MNIKNILTIRFSVIVAAILFILSLSVYQFSSIYRDKEFNERLLKRIERKVDHLLNTQKLDSSKLALFYNLQLQSLPYENLHIFDSNGKNIFSSNIISEKEKAIYNRLAKTNSYIFERQNERDYVAFVFSAHNKNYHIVASAVDELGYARMKYLKYLLAFQFVIGLLITAIAGWYYAHRALAPINEIIKQVDNITATNLHNRVLAANYDDEIGLLATRFNKMLERLEESFKLQKLFVANASHEFRTPLTAIKGEIDVLLMQKRNEDDYIKVLKSITEEINKQINLLNALRDLAQTGAETNTKDAFKPCPIAEVISDVISDLVHVKPNYSINLHFNNFSENEKSVNTYGNYSLLKSCFNNLIDNACKFSVNNKADVLVDFKNTSIIVTVSDKGVGIGTDDLKHVFEPFYRSNNTRNIDGFGIGLSLVKKIVDLHNGIINIQSKEGEGTTVTVTLKNMI
ncbi:MAG: ATP-binding protein [Bacteroidia bacterium]